LAIKLEESIFNKKMKTQSFLLGQWR